MRRKLLVPLLASACLLLGPMASQAEPPAHAHAPLRLAIQPFTLGTPAWALAPLRSDRSLPRRSHALRAEARAVSRLGVFAEGRGFAVGRHGSIYDIEGGAFLNLTAPLSLTGSYRMLGWDYELSGSARDPQSGGPFLGLALDF